MSKKPARTWALMLSLGGPLAVVGGAAMLTSFATLIDVARLSGLPFPGAFPIVVDVGMIGSMIAAAQLKLRGLGGRWLAYVAFFGLAAMSVVANATHSAGTADLSRIPLWAAAVIGAVPPATLLVMTHLVMGLVPDAKERAKLQRERNTETPQTGATPAQRFAEPASPRLPASAAPATLEAQPRLHLVAERAISPAKEEVARRVAEFHQQEGRRPTGAQVGEWLGGKTAKTGQRFLAQMELDGSFDPSTSGESEPDPHLTSSVVSG